MCTCDKARELLSARLDGEENETEAAELAAHLADCPECRGLAADLEELHAVMSGMAAVPPATIMENVMGRISAEDGKVVAFAPGHKSRAWRAWIGAAAMMAVALTGVYALRHMGGANGAAPVPATLDASPSAAVSPSPSAALENKLLEPRTAQIPWTEKEPEEAEGGMENGEAGSVNPQTPPTGDSAQDPEKAVIPYSRVPEESPLTSIPTPNPEPSPGETYEVMPTTGGEPPGLMIQAPASFSVLDAESLDGVQACERIYERLFAQQYPDAQWLEEEDFRGYLLADQVPAWEDGERTVSLMLAEGTLNEKETYYVCKLLERGEDGADSILNELALSTDGTDRCLSRNEHIETYFSEVDGE